MIREHLKRSRVLYIVTQGEQGGAQKYICDLAPSMTSLGHEVFIATGEQKEEKDKWLFDSLTPTLSFGEGAMPNLFIIENFQREIKVLKDIKSVFSFIKLYRQIKPDLVHLNSSKAGFTGSLSLFICNLFSKNKIKTVYTVHGFVFLEPQNILKKIFYIALEFISSKLRNFTILISQKDLDIGKEFKIINPRKNNFKIIYNGLKNSSRGNVLGQEDARKFIFDKLNFPHTRRAGVKIVGCVANFYKTKGLEYFIESASLTPTRSYGEGEVLFVHIGFGDEKYKKELENLVIKNNLQNNFFFLGKIPNALNYLKAFEVFALTSVKEGMPYTLLEAHLAGVPIVATNVGGIPEMAKHIEIKLAENRNSRDIAEKILEQLENKGSSDNALPEIFSLEKMIHETELVYKGILG